MQRLFGREIYVHIDNGSILFGILNDITDDSVYVLGERLYIIPKENISFYSVDPDAEAEGAPDNILKVYINEELVATMEVPSHINLDVWNNDIYQLAVSNSDVQALLANRVQQSVEYAERGMMVIRVRDIPKPPVSDTQNTFSMNANGPAGQFLNPIEMATRLNNVAVREKDGKSQV